MGRARRKRNIEGIYLIKTGMGETLLPLWLRPLPESYDGMATIPYKLEEMEMRRLKRAGHERTGQAEFKPCFIFTLKGEPLAVELRIAALRPKLRQQEQVTLCCLAYHFRQTLIENEPFSKTGKG